MNQYVTGAVIKELDVAQYAISNYKEDEGSEDETAEIVSTMMATRII